MFSLPLTTIFVFKKIWRQKLAHLPIIFPPNKTILVGIINDGRNIIEIIDKDKLIDNFKDNESAKNQNPPPPNQPKSSGFRNNAGE